MEDAHQKVPAKHTGGITVVLAAIAIQLTLGIAYLWSIFQTGVAETIFNGDNASAGLTFSLLLATLTIGSVLGGKLAAKYSTRIVVFAGGIILATGFFSASFVTAEHPWLLWVTYGVMGGTGMGFTYSTTIACAQKWYPHKRGFVTGIIVSALGLGGVVFTPVIEGLIKTFGGVGKGEPKTFMVLAGTFLVICTIGCLFLNNPPESESAAAVTGVSDNNITPAQMLKTPQYYIIVAAFALACLGGLMIINYAKPLAVMKGFEPETAAFGVIAISLFNSFGRLFWGTFSDKVGRINTLIILLAGASVAALFVNAVVGWSVFILLGFIGFFYGGFLSNFPSLTADTFGVKHLATNYGFVLLGFGAGAISASQIGGHFKNIAVEKSEPDLMFPAFIIGSCCSAA
ncbi:MAG: OFA family MFS transporter, partial [Oscillospiraceae bacterium]|nr:OFA family MFS transporter [Oscillospiraceae bacterium]